jgi:hypothetical protein
MKTVSTICTGLFISTALLLTSCDGDGTRNDRHDDTREVNNVDVDRTTSGNVEIETRDYRKERDDYNVRMNTRLGELDNEIEELRKERAAEKDKVRVKEYDIKIEQRERSRKGLKERLNNAANKADAEWDEFKRDVDNFFDGDLNNDGK